jgi:hypothetical protein
LYSVYSSILKKRAAIRAAGRGESSPDAADQKHQY